MPRSIHKRWLVLLLAPLALAAVACTNNSLDDGDGPDVVLEIDALENPPISASLDQATGICTFTVEDWSVNATNLPKNDAAEDSSPFNDIAMISVTVVYNWIDPGIATPDRVFGLGGIVIPVGASSVVTFQPIALDDLSLALQSSTANLSLTFEGVTVEGTRMRATVGRQLTVESCQ